MFERLPKFVLFTGKGAGKAALA